MGASSFSPSPITTTPLMATLSSTKRIASTAAWSALSFSPRPIQRAAAIAAASVTRTSSMAMLRSGAWRAVTARDPMGSLLLDGVSDEPRHHDLEDEQYGHEHDAADQSAPRLLRRRRDHEADQHGENSHRVGDRSAAERRGNGDENERRPDAAGELQPEQARAFHGDVAVGSLARGHSA